MKTKKKKSYKYIYSPLILGGALIIFVFVFFPEATGLPTTLLGLVVTATQIHPKWKKLPDSLHNALVWGGITIFILTIFWLLRLCINKKQTKYEK